MANANGNNGYGSQDRKNLALTREILAYPMILAADPASEEFKTWVETFNTFYTETILPWLEKNRVASCHTWIIGKYLVILSSPAMPPWSIGSHAIPGLGTYLGDPLPIQELGLFSLQPIASTDEYKEAAA